jgi:rod shape-determining protein MreD
MARCIILGAMLTYLVAVLQATLSGRLAVFGVSPDLPFVWSVSVGLLAGPQAGLLAGFGSGVVEGALRQAGIGALAIGRGASGLVAGVLATKMFRDNPLVPAACAAVLTLLNELVFVTLSHAQGWHQAGRVLGVRVVCHSVLTPICAILLRHACKLLTRRRAEAR